jgi:hypothetical protein
MAEVGLAVNLPRRGEVGPFVERAEPLVERERRLGEVRLRDGVRELVEEGGAPARRVDDQLAPPVEVDAE